VAWGGSRLRGACACGVGGGSWRAPVRAMRYRREHLENDLKPRSGSEKHVDMPIEDRRIDIGTHTHAPHLVKRGAPEACGMYYALTSALDALRTLDASCPVLSCISCPRDLTVRSEPKRRLWASRLKGKPMRGCVPCRKARTNPTHSAFGLHQQEQL
jgi:hypothetical protein